VAAPGLTERARAALRRHGPAVSGEGGNHRTFVAARIALNDFGLAEHDAWDLLLEYNRTCQPQWPEGELRRIFDSAARHGYKNRG
jgi:hypothetical protein